MTERSKIFSWVYLKKDDWDSVWGYSGLWLRMYILVYTVAKIFAEANFYGWNAIFLQIYCIRNRLNIWLQIICEKMQIFYIITIEIEYTIQFICMFFTFSFICMNVQNISKLLQNISKLAFTMLIQGKFISLWILEQLNHQRINKKK